MTAPTAAEVAKDLDESFAYLAEHSAKMNPVPPNVPKKKQRNIRVEDPLWEKAEAKAAKRGTSVSEYVRTLIDRDTLDDE